MTTVSCEGLQAESKKNCMSPKVHYPLEQTCLCSDNLIIHTGEPDLSDYKSSPVAVCPGSGIHWREAPQSGKPVRGGTGIDTLLRVPSC